MLLSVVFLNVRHSVWKTCFSLQSISKKVTESWLDEANVDVLTSLTRAIPLRYSKVAWIPVMGYLVMDYSPELIAEWQFFQVRTHQPLLTSSVKSEDLHGVETEVWDQGVWVGISPVRWDSGIGNQWKSFQGWTNKRLCTQHACVCCNWDQKRLFFLLFFFVHFWYYWPVLSFPSAVYQ